MSQEKPDAGALSWPKLAIRLQTSRQSLFEWRKLPDAPEVPDESRWRAFIELMELGKPTSGPMTGSREELLKANLTKKNRLLDLQIAKEEKSVVDRSEVDALFMHISTLAKTTLYPALERELPPRAEGRTAAEISLVGREIADRICEQMARDVEAWSEG